MVECFCLPKTAWPPTCYHHQAIKTVGEKLIASATAPDGVVEAVELPGESFVLGVQWHPEREIREPRNLALFRALVSACNR